MGRVEKSSCKSDGAEGEAEEESCEGVDERAGAEAPRAGEEDVGGGGGRGAGFVGGRDDEAADEL